MESMEPAASHSSRQQRQQAVDQYGSVSVEDSRAIKNTRSVPIRTDPWWYVLADHTQLLFALSLASYAGVAVRIYLSMIGAWDGFAEFSSMYPQLLGTGILGVLVFHKEQIQKHHKVLYTGLSTGLCGSMTTFSTWNIEAAYAVLRVNKTSFALLQEPYNASGPVTFITILLIGIAAPVGALHFGKNIATWLPRESECIDSIGCESTVIRAIAVFIFWVFVTVAIVAPCVVFQRLELLFSLLMGTAGTYLRWWLSFLDKPAFHCRLCKGFPIGTLIANVSGTWLIGLTYVAKAYAHSKPELSEVTVVLPILAGIITGFCGCLTTVSTFVGQLNSLPFSTACVYTVVSISLAQLGLIPVLAVYLYYQ